MRNGSWGVLLVSCLAFAACAGPGVDDAYPLNQVEILSVTPAHDGTVSITYRTAEESMGHCPGAFVEEEGDTLRVWFARASTGDTLVPDVPAVSDSAKGTSTITIPKALQKRVVLDDGANTRTVWELKGR